MSSYKIRLGLGQCFEWLEEGWSSQAIGVRRAEDFIDYAIHEWKHVADFQIGGLEWGCRMRVGPSGRRPNWSNRPEEIRAVEKMREVLGNERPIDGKYGDLIAPVAAAIGRIVEGKVPCAW